jgi:hypothetical protein
MPVGRPREVRLMGVLVVERNCAKLESVAVGCGRTVVVMDRLKIDVTASIGRASRPLNGGGMMDCSNQMNGELCPYLW